MRVIQLRSRCGHDRRGTQQQLDEVTSVSLDQHGCVRPDFLRGRDVQDNRLDSTPRRKVQGHRRTTVAEDDEGGVPR